MTYVLDRPAGRDRLWVLQREWLETNGLGDYSSSSLLCCNTRKYHGLFTVNLSGEGGGPSGRYVLLSTVEDWLEVQDEPARKKGRHGSGAKPSAVFPLSSRRHPDVYYPAGHEFLDRAALGLCPAFRYLFRDKGGGLAVTREVMLLSGRRHLMIRYLLEAPSGGSDAPSCRLLINPLLAFRGFHELARANNTIDRHAGHVRHGFSIKPYEDLPTLFMQLRAGRFQDEAEAGKGSGKAMPSRRVRDCATFVSSPDWYYACRYDREAERGFASSEDLLKPGQLSIRLRPGVPVYLSVALEKFETAFPKRTDNMEKVWQAESSRRREEDGRIRSLDEKLAREGRRFIVNLAGGKNLLAGYHWFDAWGRDSMISLAGLTVCAGLPETGLEILSSVGAACKDGLIPNMFGPDGKSHAYNSVDASLWYLRAVQLVAEGMPGCRHGGLVAVKDSCWPVIKKIIKAYSSGVIPAVKMDRGGFLHVGGADTQLTWMDAVVGGRPVTPRNGSPVEINALWYNGLGFANVLARAYGEEPVFPPELWSGMRMEFTTRYLVRKGGSRYLADVWDETLPGHQDASLRPNQLFAVGLPFSILEEAYQGDVLFAVKKHLLTPFGLRTLAPDDPRYCGQYSGGPSERDSAYHQGTVWPWLLGIYGEALLKASKNVEQDAADLLKTITPLFTEHLADAGVGSISEIFSGNAPHKPDGCIAQAWSVAECLRLLLLLKDAAPGAYAKWEGKNITINSREHTSGSEA